MPVNFLFKLRKKIKYNFRPNQWEISDTFNYETMTIINLTLFVMKMKKNNLNLLGNDR